jgi:hypothetical protein
MQIAISQDPLAAILDCPSSSPAPAICASLKRNPRTQEIAIVAAEPGEGAFRKASKGEGTGCSCLAT